MDLPQRPDRQTAAAVAAAAAQRRIFVRVFGNEWVRGFDKASCISWATNFFPHRRDEEKTRLKFWPYINLTSCYIMAAYSGMYIGETALTPLAAPRLYLFYGGSNVGGSSSSSRGDGVGKTRMTHCMGYIYLSFFFFPSPSFFSNVQLANGSIFPMRLEGTEKDRDRAS